MTTTTTTTTVTVTKDVVASKALYPGHERTTKDDNDFDEEFDEGERKRPGSGFETTSTMKEEKEALTTRCIVVEAEEEEEDRKGMVGGEKEVTVTAPEMEAGKCSR